MSEAELIHNLNYKSEKLFNVIDTYDNQLYPIKKKDPEKFNEIMTHVYEKTHKTELSEKKLGDWIENFPNMIDRKIQAEKTKLKKKLKSPKRAKKGQEIYVTSPLRNRNLLNKMEKLGYYSINTKSKTEKMKAGLKDDEIVADLVEEISDPYGGDHDMVEIMYDDQFKRHIEEYEEKYKYVYAVEDIKPKKKKKKRDILIRKDIISVPRKPKEEVELKKKRVKITPVKKPIKEKIKLFSSIILSENPIKITPAEKLEYVKKKPPTKKKPSIKKKPISKKPPTIKRKPIPKKKPIVKKKPLVKKKKPIIKKKPGKKPIVKKKPTPKKKPVKKKKRVAKKKPKPKVKTMRAKRRNSPITGRWTARYRIIHGKKRKVKIRKFKGKIQTRIIN